MPNPKPPVTHPFKVNLEKGKKYFWCACGNSANQPFCDGSHKGTEFTPELVKVDEDKEVWFCGCKQSGNKPYCDGTHKSL